VLGRQQEQQEVEEAEGCLQEVAEEGVPVMEEQNQGAWEGLVRLLEEPSRALARAKALRKALVVVVRLLRQETGEGRLESRRARVFVMVVCQFVDL
jgi:hypothetical protein